MRVIDLYSNRAETIHQAAALLVKGFGGHDSLVKVVQIDGVGHMVHQSLYEPFVDAIRTFLDGIPSRPSSVQDSPQGGQY